jgi:two-component system, NarL family, response regulator NreC
VPSGSARMTAGKIKVLLVDDHTLLRQGLRAILEREADIRVVGEASDGRDALRKATALRPDVVVMDISMPRVSGVEATRSIRSQLPDTRIVTLSMHEGEDYVESVLRAGATGYVLKDAPAKDLVTAIRAAREGGIHLDPRISASVVARYLETRPPEEPRPATPEIPLTPREVEVLKLIASGQTNRAIAKHLTLSIKTVEAHRTRIMSKLNVHNVAGLTRYALGKGMIRPV